MTDNPHGDDGIKLSIVKHCDIVVAETMRSERCRPP